MYGDEYGDCDFDDFGGIATYGVDLNDENLDADTAFLVSAVEEER